MSFLTYHDRGPTRGASGHPGRTFVHVQRLRANPADPASHPTVQARVYDTGSASPSIPSKTAHERFMEKRDRLVAEHRAALEAKAAPIRNAYAIRAQPPSAFEIQRAIHQSGKGVYSQVTALSRNSTGSRLFSQVTALARQTAANSSTSSGSGGSSPSPAIDTSQYPLGSSGGAADLGAADTGGAPDVMPYLYLGAALFVAWLIFK